MNSVVSLPIVAALPVAAPAMPSTTDRRALHAYASWLFMERRILCGELWPHMGAEAERYDWFDNAGAGWHFRGRGDLAWNEGPQPSSRAAAVMDLAGVDWRQPQEDLGLNHQDNGERPPLPAGWPMVDGELINLVERFAVAEAEWCRLNRIWDEMPENNGNPPAALKIRESDADLRIPQPDQKNSQPEIYSGGEVEGMRLAKWRDRAGSSYVEDEDVAIVTIRHFTPSPAARSRADEIVAAYDKTNRKSRAYRAAERAADRACEISSGLARQIAKTRPTSVQGFVAKARCVKILGGETDVKASLIDDLLAMTKASVPTTA